MGGIVVSPPDATIDGLCCARCTAHDLLLASPLPPSLCLDS